MATLSITKTYEDGTSLFESDLDNFRDALLDLINTTKLNGDNIQDGGVAITNVSETILDSTYFQISTSGIEVKDESIGIDKLASPEIFYDYIGSLRMFHTYNGTLSIPRGWMICNGNVINETNYNSLHGAGAYTTDGISSSALLSKYLPNFANAYPQGATSTTASGSSAIPTVGSNTDNYVHHHDWLSPSLANGHRVYQSNGTTLNAVSGTSSEPYNFHWYSAANTINFSGSAINLTTANETISIDLRPISYAVNYIMKVI